MERLARTLSTITHQPVGDDNRIHRASTRAADGVNPQSTVFQNAVKYSPRKGAVGATTLKCEID